MLEDCLSATAVTDNLKTRFIGRPLVYYPALATTMAEAGQAARQGAVEGTVILADEQTEGRGRLGRRWLSPRGNVAFSVVLRPGRAELPSLIMLAALAVVRSLRAVTGLDGQVKWPNDVLINGRKVCGILTESALKEATVDYAIIGIGLNVNLPAADLAGITPAATSLAVELGRAVPRRDLICRLLLEMEQLYLSLRGGGSLYQEWRDNLVTLGKPVRVTVGRVVYEGVAEDVARDGRLRLRQPDGRMVDITAGDVTLRE
ncbi:MAG: biotin--[acetyl-CoA-carboxylase] ligase [Chloroflexota bacterium]